MTGLEFLASVIGSLAWPSVVVAVLVVLREPLRELVPLLQRLKYKDVELEFGRRAQEINAEVVAELPPGSTPAVPALPETSAVARLAEISPRAAVLEAWHDVELAATTAVVHLAIPVPASSASPLSSYQALRLLERAKEIDPTIRSALRNLRSLRNEAAHAPEFALSTESALEYAEAAQRVAAHLRAFSGGA